MIENQTIAFDDLETGETYQDCHITYSQKQLRLMDITLIKCTFDQRDFSGAELVDCVIKGCQLANTRWGRATIYGTQLVNCGLTGVDFNQNNWKQTRMENCKADYANFSGSCFTDCQFTQCQLIEAYLQGVTVKGNVSFKDTDLDGADFTDTALAGVNLADSTFTSLVVTPNLLRGCIINAYQAPLFAALMGMNVID